ncbi:DUF5753 domain-containing protein [Actinacidiphila sp. ITFR-21]|uniref:DUF5753 domain-containing protein n=1 Tax=Actinacidiphila sp. ITFR-21 TaxID=3075199 RepID=UPI00288BC5BE|nr:DUF5753 domain-containing protein [Streptomyces sp. ITFR-21]WNI17649.1 DUF5753 domain-containing protein [Streptomyces sp. ITFR-21]WNI17789.1 DUF5753 domain-containing protein [Streptomyces sp. ITFR-21]
MSVNTAAMVARERFAEALKAARIAARTPQGESVKQIDVARAMGRETVDRYSRLERATAWPDDAEWSIILRALHVDLETSVRLDTMRREGMAIGQGRYAEFDDEFPESLLQFVAWEDAARLVKTCSANTFPALIQCERYAEALTLAQTGSPRGDYSVTRSVELRMKRREIFEKSQPPSVEALFSEGALHQLVGGAEVMAAQLDSLIVDAKRGVSMRIVPFGASATPVYMFHILEFNGADEKPIAAVDSMTGMTFRKVPKDAREVREFRRTYDVLRSNALSPEESLEMIITRRKELTRAA